MELLKITNIREKISSAKEIEVNKLAKIEIIVAIISMMLGTILHFTYQWSNGNSFIAIFSSVNESVWEHLKLIFFPMLILAVLEYFFVKEIVNNYIEAKTIGIFLAMCFTVVTFFTYTGIIGTDSFIINIIIFITSIILGEYAAYKLMKRKNESSIKTKILAIFIISFLFICFILCTFFTPRVNLFKDPNTGNYGIIEEKL